MTDPRTEACSEGHGVLCKRYPFRCAIPSAITPISLKEQEVKMELIAHDSTTHRARNTGVHQLSMAHPSIEGQALGSHLWRGSDTSYSPTIKPDMWSFLLKFTFCELSPRATSHRKHLLDE